MYYEHVTINEILDALKNGELQFEKRKKYKWKNPLRDIIDDIKEIDLTIDDLNLLRENLIRTLIDYYVDIYD